MVSSSTASWREVERTIEAGTICFYYMPPPAIVGENDLGLPGITTEAQSSMNASCILAFGGLYAQAFHCLRQILEAVILCSSFTLYELGSGKIRAWREGTDSPPGFSESLRKIVTRSDQQVIRDAREIRTLYGYLCSWTHLQRVGSEYVYSPFDSHFRFEEGAFADWVTTFLKTLRLSMVNLLATFPSYTLRLPNEEIPDSWAGPWNCTFPDPRDRDLVADAIGEPEWFSLTQLTKTDRASTQVVMMWEDRKRRASSQS